jgi:uncharacterized protein (TIGR02452 family)
MTKEERVQIFRHTTDTVRRGKYKANDGTDKEFYREDEMLKGTKFYSKGIRLNFGELTRYENAEVKVIDLDCLYAAEQLLHEGLRPAVLNMASFHTPGGGVERGSAAQEESIFRRTDIFRSLYQFHSIGENYGIAQLEERYPLEMHYGAVYTPNVMVFKSAENDGCKLLNDPFFIDVITIPAVRKPELINGKLPAWVIDALKLKIRQMFNIALENGNDSLVLSAFGCGAYGTPPKEMARLFHEVITSEKYKNTFKKIVFAIINLPSTNGTHNPEGNFKPFAEEFNK